MRATAKFSNPIAVIASGKLYTSTRMLPIHGPKTSLSVSTKTKFKNHINCYDINIYPNEYIDAHKPAMMLYVLISVSQPTCLEFKKISKRNQYDEIHFGLFKIKITLRVEVMLDMWVHRPMQQMFQSEQGI
jgi:hypothetical protein